MIESGKVVEVIVESAGSTLDGDHAAGVGVLTVVNVSAFDPEGGTLRLDGDVPADYDYLSTDEDASTIELAGVLSADVDDESPVLVLPEVPVKTASVALDLDGDEVIEGVGVPHTLDPLLAEGIRDPEAAETVTLTEFADGSYVIADVIGRRPALDGSVIDGHIPPAALTDGNPPVDAPVPVASPFAIAAVQADWAPLDPVANPDPNHFLVHASLTSPVPEDGSAYQYETKSTAARISQIDGVPIPAGVATEVFMKIQSADADGLGPFSAEVSATTRTADGFITAEWIAAITIEAQQIVAGRFSAGQGLFGDFIEVDGDASSITIFGDVEHEVPLIQLRPEGSVFRGRVIADDVSVLNGLILQGIASQIAQGAGVTIMNGVADPLTPPTLTPVTTQTTWPAVPSDFNERGIFWDSTASRWLRLLTPKTGTKAGTCKVQRITAAGAVDSEITLGNLPGVTEWDFNSICRIGSSYFSMMKDNADAWAVAKWSTSGTYEAWDFGGSPMGGSTLLGSPAVGVHGSDLVVAYTYITGGIDHIRFERWTTALVYAELLAGFTWSGAKSFSFVGIQNFDFGSSHLVFTGDGPGVYCGTLSGGIYTDDPTKRFVLAALAGVTYGGVGWNGTNFFSTHGTTGVLHKYSGYYPSASQKAYVDHADTGSGKITLPSPVANVAIPARRYLQIALPPSGATSSDVFVGLGTSQPADSAMLKRSETLTGRNMLINPSTAGSGTHSSLRTLTSVTRSGTIATGTTSADHGYAVGNKVLVKGAAAPLSGTFVIDTVPTTTTFTYTVADSGSTSSSGTVLANTFGAGSPGWMQSEAVPGWKGSGDGEFTVRTPLTGPEAANKDYVDAGPPTTSYVPTWTNVTPGTSTNLNTASYSRVGDWVMMRFLMRLGTGGSFTGVPTMSLPFTPVDDFLTGDIGVARLVDASPSTRRHAAVQGVAGSATVTFEVENGTPIGVQTSASAPWTWTVNDYISGTLTYLAVPA